MKTKPLLAKFSNITKFNSQFSKCNVAIAYHGDNRNYTSISKEVFEKAIPSLYGIPVVGEWKEEKDDFGGHGGKLEISDDGVKYIETTKPYGFIDSQAKVWWEEMTEEDGSVHEYLMTECFLWTGRYPEVTKVLEGKSNQSMEIMVKDGNEREDGYFEITDFEFSALCILGSDVEPCFEGAGFRQFNLDKETFKEEFNLMVKELKQSLLEGGEMGVDENMKKDEFENVEENKEPENAEQELDNEIENQEEQNTENNTEKNEKEDFDEQFAEDEVVSIEDYKNLLQELMNLQADYNALKEDYDKLKAENDELKAFKENIEKQQKQAEIDEVFEKYSNVLDPSDMEDLKEKAIDMDILELEKELSFRLVQKKFNFNKVTKKDSTKVIIKDNNDNNEPYGSAAIYFKK